MADKFKKGDVVRLRSGGPDMTVEKYEGSQVRCKYFAGALVMDEKFEEDTLQLATKPAPASSAPSVVKPKLS